MRESEGSAWDMVGAAAAGICSTHQDLTTFYIRRDGSSPTMSSCEQECTSNLACDVYCFSETSSMGSCMLYGGTCSARSSTSDRDQTCYRKPASFYTNINGHHLPGDASNLNHLDISLSDRATSSAASSPPTP